MMDKEVELKARVIFEWTYLAQPRYYVDKCGSIENLTVHKIIEIDKENAKENMYLFLEACVDNDPIVEITEVKKGGN